LSIFAAGVGLAIVNPPILRARGLAGNIVSVRTDFAARHARDRLTAKTLRIVPYRPPWRVSGRTDLERNLIVGIIDGFFPSFLSIHGLLVRRVDVVDGVDFGAL